MKNYYKPNLAKPSFSFAELRFDTCRILGTLEQAKTKNINLINQRTEQLLNETTNNKLKTKNQ